MPLSHEADIPISTVFAGLDEDGEALRESMAREEIVSPLLLVGRAGAELQGSATPGLNDFVSRSPRYGLPPGRILVDHDSPVEEIRELLIQQVGVALSRGEEVLELQAVAAAIHPYWASVAGQRSKTSSSGSRWQPVAGSQRHA